MNSLIPPVKKTLDFFPNLRSYGARIHSVPYDASVRRHRSFEHAIGAKLRVDQTELRNAAVGSDDKLPPRSRSQANRPLKPVLVPRQLE